MKSPFDAKATTLPFLRYIVALAEAGSFRQAAAQCHVSQPTLSAAISQWEKRMGCLLCERNRHHLHFTAIGKRVVEQSQRILDQLETLEAYAIDAQPPFYGPLRLGVIPTVAPYLLPYVHQGLNQAYEHLSMAIIEGTTNELITQLMEGQLDCALLALTDTIPQQLMWQELFNEPFIAAVPKTEQHADKTSISNQELLNQRLLLLEEGHCLRDQALAVCGLEYEQPPSAATLSYRATSLETLRQLVVANYGVTILPALAAREPHPQLTYLPLTEPSYRTIILLWRRNDSRSEHFTPLAQAMKKSVRFGESACQ